jgi:hypothetical protein
MINEKEFINRIKGLPKTIYSKTKKASYTSFKLEGAILNFQRVNPKTSWTLDIQHLYDIYRTNDFINTSVIKNITQGRVNSPSVAVLMEIRCIDEKGNKIH